MTYILIIIIAMHGQGQAIAIHDTHYLTEKACLDAKSQLDADADKWRYDQRTYCTPQGKTLE